MTSDVGVEQVVERRFHLHCCCGASFVTADKTTTCPDCGETLEVRRVRKRGPSQVVVEYDSNCCFCGVPIVTAEKSATCTNCGKTIRIVRDGHEKHRHTAPRLGTLRVGPADLAFLIALCLLLTYYLYDLVPW